MNQPKIHIILDNIRSAFNVGALFRTADATGCAMLHLCGMTAYPPNPKLGKTALGATEFVPWKHYSKTTEAINQLKTQNIPVYSIELANDSQNLWKTNFAIESEIALVLGHEVHGIPNQILSISDKIIEIPMFGQKNSLNVATAGGIVIMEALKQMKLGSN